MHYTTTALVAAFAGLAIANPINNLDTRTALKAVNIVQVSSGNKKVKAAPALAVLNTYAKFGKVNAAPANVKSAAAAAATRQSGAVTASPEQYDEEYLCPVVVGGKTLNLDFDTGSADLWVYSSLQSTSSSSGHDVYNVSSGTKQNGQSWSISYGDGSGASGVVYSDKVVIGPVTATSQAVEAATSVSSAFIQDTANDGLVGLAFSNINTVRPNIATTFFDTVKSSLKSQLFAVDLKKGTAGSYQFGYIDTTKYVGPITYVPVDNSRGYWGFSASGYQVGGGSKINTAIGSAIADTGTTLLYLPSSVVNAYYAKVPGATNSASAGGWIFPCSTNLPSFTVTIGGTPFTIPGSYLNYSPVGSQCFGGMQPNTGIGFSIFGDIFLKAIYAVFDQTQSSPRLGFARQS